MIKKNLVGLVLAALYLTNPLKAQTTAKSDSSSTVIIFNSGSTQSKKKRSSENNIVKVVPLGFIAGKVPLIYERRITDFLSIQLGAGATLRNYSRSIWHGSLRETETNDEVEYKSSVLPAGVEDRSDVLYNYDNRKATVGYMFSVQPKLYFANEGMDGGYISFSADVYKYNFTIPGIVMSNDEFKHTGTEKKEYENLRDLMVHYGLQRLYDNLSLEYSVGLGLRSVNGVKYVAGKDNTTFYDGENKYSKSDISFAIGFKVGYHF